MYILVVMLLASSNIPLDHIEFDSKQSCDRARTSIINSMQLKYKNVYAECFSKN